LPPLLTLAIASLFSCSEDSGSGGSAGQSPSHDAGADSEAPTDSGVPDDAEVVDAHEGGSSNTVEASVGLIDAVSGTAPAGAEITFADETVIVEQGTAAVDVPSGAPFEILADAPGYSRYHLFGLAGTADFELVSFVSSDSLTSQVMTMLGETLDDSRGILVVGMDTPSLQPAVGASVSIDADSGQPFIFAGQVPEHGNEVIEGGSSFVSFPNTSPGPVQLTVTPPDGQACHAYPGPGEMNEIDVHAGDVSVVSYTCE